MHALETKPALHSDLAADYEAFVVLSSCRPVSGMGISPIPLTDILAYMNMFSIHKYSQRHEFLRRIKILDNTWLSFQSKKTEIKSNGRTSD